MRDNQDKLLDQLNLMEMEEILPVVQSFLIEKSGGTLAVTCLADQETVMQMKAQRSRKWQEATLIAGPNIEHYEEELHAEGFTDEELQEQKSILGNELSVYGLGVDFGGCESCEVLLRGDFKYSCCPICGDQQYLT